MRFTGILLPNQSETFGLLSQAVGNLLVGGDRSPASGHNHDVVAPPVFRFGETIGLPNAAADAVSYHSVADLCAGGDPKTVAVQAVFPAVDHNTAPGGGFSPLIEAPEQVVLFKRLGEYHGTFPSGRGLLYGNKHDGANRSLHSPQIDRIQTV